MPEQYFWCQLSGAALNQAVPSQVVREIVGSDAVKTADPLLEARVVGIDVLDVKDRLADVLTDRYINGLMRQAELVGCGAVDAGAIAA